MKKRNNKAHDKPMSKTTLDDSPSHLLHRVLQIALDIYNAEAGEGALSQRQYAVLKVLEAASEGMSQTDLVKATGIDRSTLADLVARMMAKDLISRERSTTDARANLVHLAEAGRVALADMQPRVLAADEKILSLLSPPKRDSFVKLLRKVTTSREAELSDTAEPKARKEKPEKPEKPEKLEKPEKQAKLPKPAKAEKDKKPHKKKDKFSAKKLKKLPFPPLSAGAAETPEPEELVHAPVVKPVVKIVS